MNPNITVLDVKTPGEYRGGHVAGSINIPLLELDEHVRELKQLQQKIIVCCASGTRSSSATKYLKSQGIACENGGTWMDVNFQYSFTSAQPSKP